VSIAAPARVTRRPKPKAAPSRPTLRLVATRPLAVGTLPFAVFIGGILASGLVVLLMLHTLAAQDAFRLHDLQVKQSELTNTEQELALAMQQQESPSSLAHRARDLGMVPTGSIAFVKVRPHGKIVGVVEPPPPPAPPAPEPTKAADSTTKPADGDTTTEAAAGADTRTSRDGQKAERHRRADSPERG
jgi:hypothetical protein